MPTEKSKPALILAHRKRLDEIEQSILMMKQHNPNLLNVEEAKMAQEKFLNKRKEYLDLTEKFEENRNKLNSLLDDTRTSAQKEKENLSYDLKEQKNQMENLQSELDELGKKVDDIYSEESVRYKKQIITRDILKRKITELEQAADAETLEQVANVRAAEKKSSPFGPILIDKNLLDNIKKSADWQKAFSNKHTFEIKENKTEGKLEFSSNEKGIQIEVSQEKITGSWKKESEQTAVPIMVELYLKAIENHKVDKHLIEGKNPDVTKLIELELAKQLKAKGTEQGEINNKKINDILNSKATETETSAQKH